MKTTLKTICLLAMAGTFASHAFAQSESKPDTVAADTVLLKIYLEQNNATPDPDSLTVNNTKTPAKPIRKVRLTKHQRKQQRQRNKRNLERLMNGGY